MTVRGSLALAVLAALLLGSAAADSEKGKDRPAKKPTGTWKKSDDKMTIVLTFTDKGAQVTIKSEKLNLDFEADYSLSRTSTLYACIRKVKEGEVTADLFAFLTSEPNAEVGAVHPKAMPVILTTSEEIETWLTADWAGAKALQRPLPDGSLEIVSRGQKRNPAST